MRQSPALNQSIKLGNDEASPSPEIALALVTQFIRSGGPIHSQHSPQPPPPVNIFTVINPLNITVNRFLTLTKESPLLIVAQCLLTIAETNF